MEFEYEKNLANRFLKSLEEGDLSVEESYRLAEKCDPVTVYFVIRYLREKYPSDRPESSGVVQRIVDLSSKHVDIAAMMKQGEEDSLKEWFDDAYAMRDYFNRPDEFVHLIVDKVES